MFKVSAKIDVKPVLKQLAGLDMKIRRKALRAAVSAAGTVVVKKAKQLVRTETKLLRKSIGKKVKVYKSGVAVCVVGARTGFRQPVIRSRGKWAPAAPPPSGYANPAVYAHLVELGTVRSRPFPFLRPAIEGQRDAILESMTKAIEKTLRDASDA